MMVDQEKKEMVPKCHSGVVQEKNIGNFFFRKVSILSYGHMRSSTLVGHEWPITAFTLSFFLLGKKRSGGNIRGPYINTQRERMSERERERERER